MNSEWSLLSSAPPSPFAYIHLSIFFFPRSKLWPPPLLFPHAPSFKPQGSCSEGLEHPFARLLSADRLAWV